MDPRHGPNTAENVEEAAYMDTGTAETVCQKTDQLENVVGASLMNQPTVWKNVSVAPKLFANYVDFCRHAAISCKDRSSVHKVLISNMKSIDKLTVYGILFEDSPYISWEYVNSLDSNAIGTISQCICLVEYIVYPDIHAKYKKMKDSLPFICCFQRDLALCNLDLEIDHVLNLILLCNMNTITGSSVVEQYTSKVLSRATRDEVLAFMAKCADYRHSNADYNECISWILKNCEVGAAFFSHLQSYLIQRENVQASMKLKAVELTHGRLRLHDKLHRNRQLTSVSTSSGVILSGDAMDTFDGWCSRVRFPNTVSHRLKKRLYMIMSLPGINHNEMVRGFTQTGLADEVLKQKIAFPDDATVSQTILQLNIQMAPFQELLDLQKSCFRAFPQRNISEMTILKYMQLYISAYQHKHIWKQCWVSVYPLLSYQVIKDVEDFVSKTPLNERMVLQILKTD